MDITKKKIGILGGGQLGKMIVQNGSQMDLNLHILELDDSYPATKVCRNVFYGNFKEYDDVLDFGSDMDIITIEIENVNTDALEKLEEMGKMVHPSSTIIKTIKDKGIQKQFLKSQNIPTSAFSIYQDKDDILQEILSGKLNLPFVQKMCTGGYDGKGVQIIRNSDDLDSLFDGHTLIEELVDIDKEISVIVARNVKGRSITYDAVEMEFDPIVNLLDIQLCPARISKQIASQAKELALKIAGELKLVGLLAIEMFIDKQGQLFVNEMAPRPHNSGHHSIEGCVTSQYNQLLRAITGMPLGDTRIISPSVLVNVLGDPEHKGDVVYEGLEEVLQMEQVYIHLYGKKTTKPYRKMGHITVMDSDLQQCMEKAMKVKQTIKVVT